MGKTGPSKDQEDRTAHQASLWEGRGEQVRRGQGLGVGVEGWRSLTADLPFGCWWPGAPTWLLHFPGILSRYFKPEPQTSPSEGALCTLGHEGYDQGMQPPPGALTSYEEANSLCGPVEWNHPSTGSCPSPDLEQEEYQTLGTGSRLKLQALLSTSLTWDRSPRTRTGKKCCSSGSCPTSRKETEKEFWESEGKWKKSKRGGTMHLPGSLRGDSLFFLLC